MPLLLNWKVYSVHLGTILSAKYYSVIKKIVKISSSGNLNRIYKFYSGRILIIEAAFHINQYYISQQSISLLSQLQKNSIFFQQLCELINAIYSSDSNQRLSGSLSPYIDLKYNLPFPASAIKWNRIHNGWTPEQLFTYPVLSGHQGKLLILVENFTGILMSFVVQLTFLMWKKRR